MRSAGLRGDSVAGRTRERKAMAQQKSERRIVPEALRKRGPTVSERRRGGKATPVKQRTHQLRLSFETADSPRARAHRGRGGAAGGVPPTVPLAAPKSKHKEESRASAMMREVCGHLRGAFRQVASNRGAPGPDRQSIEQVREHLDELLPALETALRTDCYRPGDIRRVWIPKSGGGQRGLGIPIPCAYYFSSSQHWECLRPPGP